MAVMMVSMIMTMVMAMIVAMPVSRAMIGAAHGMERFGYLANRSAKPVEHVPDDMVTQDEDARFLDLRRQMAVAEMPGEFDEMQAVLRCYFVKRLFGGDHLDRLAGLREEKLAMSKLHGLLEVEHDDVVALRVQELAAHVALIMRQQYAIDGRVMLTASVGQDLRGAMGQGRVPSGCIMPGAVVRGP